MRACLGDGFVVFGGDCAESFEAARVDLDFVEQTAPGSRYRRLAAKVVARRVGAALSPLSSARA